MHTNCSQFTSGLGVCALFLLFLIVDISCQFIKNVLFLFFLFCLLCFVEINLLPLVFIIILKSCLSKSSSCCGVLVGLELLISFSY